jgi:hypothetical protein
MPITHPLAFKPATLETTIGGGITAVEKYTDFASFPSPGMIGIIYIALDTDKAYLWDDNTMQYVPIDTQLTLVDNLNSSDATKALTANMGRVLNEKIIFQNEPTGFGLGGDGEVDKSTTTISFSDSSPDRTFSIQPTGSDFTYYYHGVEYVSTGDTVQIPDTEGLFWIYYEHGVLKQASSALEAEVVANHVLVAVVYWDATNKTAIYLADERHGSRMDGHTHSLNHFTRGTQFISGLSLTSILVDQTGNLDTHAQFGKGGGSIRDEDLITSSAAILSTVGFPIFYRLGGTGDWRKQTNAGFSVLNTGTGRLAYNQFTGGAWQQTEVGNAKFVLYHLFATNDLNNPLFSIMGQNEYDTVTNARLGATTEISNLVTGGMPFVEFVPVGTVIFQTSDSYSNSVKARIRSTGLGDDYVDWRFSAISPTVSSVSDHGNLAGLADDDHLQYHNDTRGDARYYQQSEFINVSAGAADAGKPVKLDAGGHIDASMINDADIDHNSVSGKQGGTTNEYYHLTATEYGNLHIPATVSDTASIDLTITGQQISGVVLPAGVDHDSLQNYAIGQHRVINDAGSETTELWSANKIIAQLALKISNSFLTTKGDLISRDASAIARLGVGSNGQILSADSTETTGLKWINNDTSKLGLVTIENYSGDLNNDIRFFGEKMWSDNGAYLLNLPTYIKKLDASFSAGDNGGLLGQGLSKTSSTWFYLYGMRKDSDGSFDYYADTSASAANIPSGWANPVLINAMLTDGSGNNEQLFQIGDTTFWKTGKLSYGGTGSTTAVTRTAAVPPGIPVLAYLAETLEINKPNTFVHSLITSLDQPDTAPSTTNFTVSAKASGVDGIRSSSSSVWVKTNTSGQYRSRESHITTVNIYITALAWKLMRSI